MKNKHAKGPDGQPLININSGRGRGRPKKNANAGLRFSHIEPTSDSFFKASADRAGGPVEPSLGFKEIYTEIFIKRAKPILPPQMPISENPDGVQGEGAENSEDKKADGFEDKNEDDDEEMKGGEQASINP